jgi:hypothetical protein
MDIKTITILPPWEWPPDTGRLLRKILTDRRADPKERALAAEHAGEIVVMDDDMARTLLTIIETPDEPEELRAAAAIALGPSLETADVHEFDDPELVPITEPIYREIQAVLERVYRNESTPKLVRRKVLEGSVRATADWHAPAIRTAYGSGDEEWMLTAVFAMGYVPGFEREILQSLDSGDPTIHREAVQAAGNRELDGAWNHVAKLLSDPRTDKDTVLCAIQAATSIRPEAAQEALTDLTDSDDEEIAAAAEEAIDMAAAMSGENADFDIGMEEDEEDEKEDGKHWIN